MYNLLKNIFFGFVIVYFSQGVLYPNGSIISKVSLLVILLISSFFLFYTMLIVEKKPVFYWVWFSLLFVNVLGYFYGLEHGGIYYSQIKNICIAILPFYFIYFLSIKNYIGKNYLLFFMLLICPLMIMSLYIDKSNSIDEYMVDENQVVSNTAYIFVALLPYVFLWGEKKLFAFLNMLLVLFFVFQGAKRGALVTSLVGMLIFLYYQITNFKPGKKLISIFFTFFTLNLFTIIVYYFYKTNEYLIYRMQNLNNTSNRDVIYQNLWNTWYNTESMFNVFFGFGFVASVEYSGLGYLAHNDWLELLINFGLFGVFLYFTILLSLIYLIFFGNLSRENKFILITIVVIWIFQTLFSMYYTSSLTLFSAILMGYILGCLKRKKHISGFE